MITFDRLSNNLLTHATSCAGSGKHSRAAGSRFYSRSAEVIGFVGEHRIEVFQVAIT